MEFSVRLLQKHGKKPCACLVSTAVEQKRKKRKKKGSYQLTSAAG